MHSCHFLIGEYKYFWLILFCNTLFLYYYYLGLAFLFKLFLKPLSGQEQEFIFISQISKVKKYNTFKSHMSKFL